MKNTISVTVHMDKNLKTDFEGFFKQRGMSFEHGLQFVMFDYLNRYKAKNLEEVMAKYRLSPREIEVCKLILKGLQTKEIADKLFVGYV